MDVESIREYFAACIIDIVGSPSWVPSSPLILLIFSLNGATFDSEGFETLEYDGVCVNGVLDSGDFCIEITTLLFFNFWGIIVVLSRTAGCSATSINFCMLLIVSPDILSLGDTRLWESESIISCNRVKFIEFDLSST